MANAAQPLLDPLLSPGTSFSTLVTQKMIRYRVPEPFLSRNLFSLRPRGGGGGAIWPIIWVFCDASDACAAQPERPVDKRTCGTCECIDVLVVETVIHGDPIREAIAGQRSSTRETFLQRQTFDNLTQSQCRDWSETTVIRPRGRGGRGTITRETRFVKTCSCN